MRDYGVVVTERIPIAKSESTPAKFYWRYGHATAAVRGRDVTVERVLDPVRAEIFREKLKFDKKDKLFRLKLGENDYIVGKLTYMGTSSPTGRSTRAFTAFCEKTWKLVFLKDTWRDNCPSTKSMRDYIRGKSGTLLDCRKGLTL